MSLYNRMVLASLRFKRFQYTFKKLERRYAKKWWGNFIRNSEKMDRDGYLEEFP